MVFVATTIETDEERATRIEAQVLVNKSKEKKTEIKDPNNRVIQREEISDDGRIIVTKTNPNGLD